MQNELICTLFCYCNSQINIMSQVQQSIFLNLSRHSKYHERSRYISEPQSYFARHRDEQIANEFELVDFNGTGLISKTQILQHLNQKYGKLNYAIIQEVFNTMEWNQNDQVTKQQFCRKYLAKQKQAFHEANRLFSLRQKLQTTREIFNETKSYRPKLYASIQIDKLYIRSQRPNVEYQEVMGVQVQFEDHKHKLDYLIEQPVYTTDQPSFELLLPTQEHYLFVKYKFLNPKSKERDYFGQCYVNYPIADILRENQFGPNSLNKINAVKVDVTKNNVVKGFCQFKIIFQSDMNKVEAQIRREEQQVVDSQEKASIKQKQYEYLQYLWGIRQKYPHKISKQEVKWVIIARVIFASILCLLSIIVHVLGRCEPLSFILAMMLLKNWKYVILRGQKFLMTWITITSICLDFIWISFAAGYLSQINYMQLTPAAILTYLMVIVKIVLLFYFLLVEKSFATAKEETNPIT